MAETKNETKTKKKTVKMLKVVCRAEGTFLKGVSYELDPELADLLIKNKCAEEKKQQDK